MDLRGVTLTDVPDQKRIGLRVLVSVVCWPLTGMRFAFQLATKNKAKTLILATTKAESKTKWMDLVQKSLRDLAERDASFSKSASSKKPPPVERRETTQFETVSDMSTASTADLTRVASAPNALQKAKEPKFV